MITEATRNPPGYVIAILAVAIASGDLTAGNDHGPHARIAILAVAIASGDVAYHRDVR